MLARYLLAGLFLWAGAAFAQDCPTVPMPGATKLRQLESEAVDRGPLWRIRRDGHDSYLYGSIHIGRPAWLFPGPVLRQAWSKTDTLVLELDPGDPQLMQALRALPTMELDLRSQKRLQAQMLAACVSEQSLAGLHPLLQVASIASIAGRPDGLDPAYAQEISLMSRARNEGRPLQALETAAEQMAALVPADAATAKRELSVSLEQMEKGRLRPMLRELADAWERGDMQALSQVEPPCNCPDDDIEREQLRRLNDGRNEALAQRIAALHASGKRALVAVGALHMSGAKALPLLLKQQGFEVEQLLPKPR